MHMVATLPTASAPQTWRCSVDAGGEMFRGPLVMPGNKQRPLRVSGDVPTQYAIGQVATGAAPRRRKCAGDARPAAAHLPARSAHAEMFRTSTAGRPRCTCPLRAGRDVPARGTPPSVLVPSAPRRWRCAAAPAQRAPGPDVRSAQVEMCRRSCGRPTRTGSPLRAGGDEPRPESVSSPSGLSAPHRRRCFSAHWPHDRHAAVRSASAELLRR